MRPAVSVAAGLVAALSLGVGLGIILERRRRRRRRAAAAGEAPPPPPLRERGGYDGLVGATPMVALPALSRALGRRVLAKAELLNPGGTAKDRIARAMIEEAEASGKLRPGGEVVEGTSGSTGIALAAQCAGRGYRCVIFMPDDQAQEKVDLLRTFGAEVHVVRTAGIANPEHYARKAAAYAEATPGAVFMDQFETLANFRAHYATSAPEIWEQATAAHGRIDAFVMSAGTGGMIAGVATFLKERSPATRVVLADPPGSALFSRLKFGVAYANQQKERGVRLHRYDTLAEGIGLDRITANLAKAISAPSGGGGAGKKGRKRRRGGGGGNAALIDGAVQVTDQEAVDMAHWLLRNEGLFVGSSSAMNVVAACRVARRLPLDSVVVTVICDSGQRHQTRFWNRSFVEGFQGRGLRWPDAGVLAAGPAPETEDADRRFCMR